MAKLSKADKIRLNSIRRVEAKVDLIMAHLGIEFKEEAPAVEESMAVEEMAEETEAEAEPTELAEEVPASGRKKAK